MRAAHLELVRDGQARFGDALCEELFSAVDEAVSLEDALRAILRILATRLRCNAGRAAHRDVAAVWYVDAHESIPKLRERDPQPSVAWDEPWTLSQRGGLCTVIFPLDWSLGACLELYGLDAWTAPGALLDDVARALVPVGAMLYRKRPSRSKESRLFVSSPVPCFVVRESDGRILLANHAAAAALGRPEAELALLRFEELLAGDERTLPAQGGTCTLRRKGGGGFIAEIRTQPHVAEDGERTLIVIATDVTDRIRAEQRLEAAVLTDPLTGLHNRVAFDRHLALAVERAASGALFAVLFIDLDRFKSVNDRYGHAVGDALLREVAVRLRTELRTGDLAARLGGDEFAVLLSLRDLAEAVPVAERLQKALLMPCTVAGLELAPSASIGVAFASGQTAGELLAQADAAMYRAKATGTGNVAFSATRRR